MTGLRHHGAGASALSVLVALAALVASAAAHGAQGVQGAANKSCRVPASVESLPGGTPAYNLTVSASRTSCAVALAVVQAFHRCRGEGRSRCTRKVLARWSCAARKIPGTSLGLPIVRFSTFVCRSGASAVHSGYQENGPHCLGAASRDPLRRCSNPTRTMTPDLDEIEAHALAAGSAGCDPIAALGACVFGVSDREAQRRFALIGDSHTFHWRAALALVSQVERWRGYTVAAGGCFFSAVTAAFSPICDQYYGTVLAWLADHPEVDTVFMSSNADTPVGVPAGETYDSFKFGGFRDAFAAMPASVKHLVVLRDTPASSPATFDCMARAQAEHKRPGTTCPLARSVALRADLAVDTVKQLRDPRYEYIDMTHYFCGRRDCYPVIGGVRVNADIFGHLTATYMRSLGPYLLRDVRRLAARW
jgi:hypothetical protein